MSFAPWAVLFDLDGTLADTAAFLLRSMRHAFEGFAGRHPTDAEWVAGIGTPLRTQLRAFAPEEAQVEALVARYRAFQKAHHDAMTFAFPASRRVLEQLHARGHALGLVTSKGEELAERTLRHLGLRDFFGAVVTAESVPRHKPDPLPVQLALEKLGARASEAVFLGDSPHDVLAGNAAGVVSIGALWGPFCRAQLEPARASHLLERLEDLPALLERIGASRAA